MTHASRVCTGRNSHSAKARYLLKNSCQRELTQQGAVAVRFSQHRLAFEAEEKPFGHNVSAGHISDNKISRRRLTQLPQIRQF